MGLILPQTVKVDVSGNMASYYEKMGYEIPRYFNKRRNTYSVVNGTTIDVSVEDLKPNSNLIVECECDICKRKESISKMEYTRIKSYTDMCALLGEEKEKNGFQTKQKNRWKKEIEYIQNGREYIA